MAIYLKNKKNNNGKKQKDVDMDPSKLIDPEDNKGIINKENNDTYKISKTIDAQIDINDIEPNPNQPRKYFDKEKISELGRSIRKSGLHQPIIVQRKFLSNGKFSGKYIIIAGERRYRAINEEYKNLTNYPVNCRVIPDDSNKEVITTIAIQENLQRENLSAYEIFTCLSKWQDETGFSVSQIAAKIGKNIDFVKKHLRFKHLPDDIVRDLQKNPKLYGFKQLLEMANQHNPNKIQKIEEEKTKKNKKTIQKDPAEKSKYVIPIEVVCFAKNEEHARKIAKMIINGQKDPKLIGNNTKTEIKEPKRK